MQKKSSLVLIVPCYNEYQSIPHFSDELERFAGVFAEKFGPDELRVVIVDNNSDDDSRQRLEELRRKQKFVDVIDCQRPGYGAALKRGFSYASSSAKAMAFLDLDNTYPLSSLLPMLTALREQSLDMVYGARIHSESKIPWIRSLGNRLYVFLLRWLLKSPLTDVCSGMRVFRSELVDQIVALKADDLSFSIEFTAMAVQKKWKLHELPIAYRDRVGESKLSVVRDGTLFLMVVLRKWLQ